MQRAQANVDTPVIPSEQGVHLQDCFVCLTWESFPIYLFMRVQTIAELQTHSVHMNKVQIWNKI